MTLEILAFSAARASLLGGCLAGVCQKCRDAVKTICRNTATRGIHPGSVASSGLAAIVARNASRSLISAFLSRQSLI